MDIIYKLTKFLPQLNYIRMCGNLGDPMMAPDIVNMLEYIFQHNPSVYITIHTNGGLRSPQVWRRLGEISQNFPLHVVFSIDGLEDTNHIYRKGVKWKILERNFLAYIGAGGRAKWEFLRFQHNLHQVDAAQQLAREWGFAEFLIKNPFGFDDYGESHRGMPVYDSQGMYASMIYEHVPHDAQPQSTVRKLFGGIPRDEYPHVHKAVVRDIHGAMADISNINLEVSCITQHDREVYVDAQGKVYPCCFLGHAFTGTSWTKDVAEFEKWITRNGYQDLLQLDPDTLFSAQLFEEIKKLWPAQDIAGLTCKNTCGIYKDNQLDKLYEQSK